MEPCAYNPNGRFRRNPVETNDAVWVPDSVVTNSHAEESCLEYHNVAEAIQGQRNALDESCIISKTLSAGRDLQRYSTIASWSPIRVVLYAALVSTQPAWADMSFGLRIGVAAEKPFGMLPNDPKGSYHSPSTTSPSVVPL